MASERQRAVRQLLTGFLPLGAGLALFLAACAGPGIYHVVEPGQTLYRIARTYGVDETRLAKANGIADPTRLEAGQRLYIPGATRPLPVAAVSSAKSETARKPAAPPPPTGAKPAAPPRARPAEKATPQLGKAEVIPGPAPAPGTFTWPVRGELVTAFGAGDGESRKGIEIAVPAGTPVSAAAAGKVIYSGELRGYGNLVILEHADSFFTVYGFNTRNLVTVDSYVGQGDRIALSGIPPGGKSPRLHFEIRKGKTAANPIFFLP